MTLLDASHVAYPFFNVKCYIKGFQNNFCHYCALHQWTEWGVYNAETQYSNAAGRC